MSDMITFGQSTFTSDEEMVEIYRDETPRERAREVHPPVRLTFVPEHETPKAYGIRFTTERAIVGDENLLGDPNDRGFILYLPKSQTRVLSENARTGELTVEIAGWVAKKKDIEPDLKVLPPVS